VENGQREAHRGREPADPAPADLARHFDAGVDDDQPSWWASIRAPSAAAHPEPPRAAHPEPDRAPPTSGCVDAREPPRPPLRPPTPRRARAAGDEVRATAHVLRVRARLPPADQGRFDELMRGPAATDIVTMLVNREEADALENLLRRLDDEPGAVDAARRTVERHIVGLGALLPAAVRQAALAALVHLWPEEVAALQRRLALLAPPEAAALIRAYLAPRA
jgi:hypothetical protein